MKKKNKPRTAPATKLSASNTPQVNPNPLPHTTGFMNGGLATNGGYDATINRGRRRQVITNLRSTDKLLRHQERDKLVSNTRHLLRNSVIVAWMLRRHLDYVSTFTFRCRTGNDEVDARIEELMDWWSRPLNCDASGRHDLYRLIRMCESLAISDGDVFVLKLDDGTIQIVEGDKVRQPTDLNGFTNVKPDDFVHGIRIDPDTTKALGYAVCERFESSYRLIDLVSSGDMLHHRAADEQRYDSVRGVSPLAAAVNEFFDLHEAKEFALAKMKLSQIFALKRTFGPNSLPDENDLPSDNTLNTSPGGINTLEVDDGDDIEFMESATPSTEFQEFFQTGIQIGLKALDLALSFYDESHSTYNGQKQAIIQYETSAELKRDNLRNMLHALTVWRLQMFMDDGFLVLPDGWSMENLKFEWAGIPSPWVDPLKEISAAKMAVDNNFASWQMVCKDRGEDWRQVMREKAEAAVYLKQLCDEFDLDETELNLFPAPQVTAAIEMPAADEGDVSNKQVKGAA